LKSLGRYEVRGILGQGAMGVVYDAHDPKLERRVAIKTVLASNLKQRFEREVRAAARLNHPNIVQVYDFGAEGDLAYIVMEHVEGRELKHYFDGQERFDLETVLGLMRDLLEALHFAHEAGIIHRDVKPANVMVAGARAKLMDFGVAHYADPEGKELEATRAGTLVGTPAYMSPEQIQGQPVDRRSDIFSAGIVLYQMLTWTKPFQGTQWELAKKIVEEDPVWPSALVQVPPDLDRVVARALAKTPELRYPTARTFAEALERVTQVASEAEKEFWEGVKDSEDAEEVALYIAQFPRGAFVSLAEQKLAALRAKAKI
jgi:eukaryotic-like serine/threonine-protein kinase